MRKGLTIISVATIAIIAIMVIGIKEDKLSDIGKSEDEQKVIGEVKRKDIMRIQRPGITEREIKIYLQKADKIKEQVGTKTNGEIQMLVMHTLKNVPVSEEEKRRYFENNKGTFGSRSYEQSATVVENLIRIEKTRMILQANENDFQE